MRCQKILESLRIFFSRRDSEISSEINNPNSSPTDTNELTPITEINNPNSSPTDTNELTPITEINNI